MKISRKAREIERKFLVTGDLIAMMRSDSYRGSSRIEQRYLPGTGEFATRLRQETRIDFRPRYTLTMKRKITDVECVELEAKLTEAEYRTWIEECDTRVLVKTRHRFKYDKTVWEVDIFQNELDGLVVAEIELQTTDQEFIRPSWLGEEVTDDPQYRNFNIVQRIPHPLPDASD